MTSSAIETAHQLYMQEMIATAEVTDRVAAALRELARTVDAEAEARRAAALRLPLAPHLDQPTAREYADLALRLDARHEAVRQAQSAQDDYDLALCRESDARMAFFRALVAAEETRDEWPTDREDLRAEVARLRAEVVQAASVERQRCIAIARGCADYMGGHSGRDLEIYHHGIDTVGRVLAADQSSYQARVVEAIGRSAESLGEPPVPGDPDPYDDEVEDDPDWQDEEPPGCGGCGVCDDCTEATAYHYAEQAMQERDQALAEVQALRAAARRVLALTGDESGEEQDEAIEALRVMAEQQE